MTDNSFSIKVDGYVNILNCHSSGRMENPFIMLNKDDLPVINKDRCFAILHTLAELSEESIPNHYKIDHGIVSLKGNYDEGALERVLWNFLKAKYRKKSMTPEKKIDKAIKELSEIYNAGIPYNLHEAWKTIGNVLDILNQP